MQSKKTFLINIAATSDADFTYVATADVTARAGPLNHSDTTATCEPIFIAAHHRAIFKRNLALLTVILKFLNKK